MAVKSASMLNVGEKQWHISQTWGPALQLLKDRQSVFSIKLRILKFGKTQTWRKYRWYIIESAWENPCICSKNQNNQR